MSTPLERWVEKQAAKLREIRFAVKMVIDEQRDDLLADLIFDLAQRIDSLESSLESRLERDPDE